MAKIVIAPDSFKGSITAVAAAEAIAEGWALVRPEDVLTLLPMADGGEGMLDVLASHDPAAIFHGATVTGPDGKPTTARWLQLSDGTAAVELAESSGIEKMPRLDPLHATSRGLGEVLRQVAKINPVRIYIGLGSSASTDGGWGALSALGMKAFDAEDNPITEDGGAALEHVSRVDRSKLLELPELVLLTDVDNPLLGELGAAQVFGPQKGASPQMTEFLDTCLSRWSAVLGGHHTAEGAGAAGGIGYGLMAAYDAHRYAGSEFLAEVGGLTVAIREADAVITGEGKYDATSMQGKVVGHIVSQIEDQPIIIAGDIATPVEHGVSLTALAGSSAAAIAEPARWLRQAGAQAAGEYTARCGTPV